MFYCMTQASYHLVALTYRIQSLHSLRCMCRYNMLFRWNTCHVHMDSNCIHLYQCHSRVQCNRRDMCMKMIQQRPGIRDRDMEWSCTRQFPSHTRCLYSQRRSSMNRNWGYLHIFRAGKDQNYSHWRRLRSYCQCSRDHMSSDKRLASPCIRQTHTDSRHIRRSPCCNPAQ